MSEDAALRRDASVDAAPAPSRWGATNRFGRFVLVAVGLFLLSGCGQLSYYSQSIRGQVGLMGKRQPVSEVIASPDTAPDVRTKLEETQRIRDFAVSELKLPQNESYRLYADLGRPYAVWNVVATPEFSLQPKQWCFLVVGCLAYRGYFAEEDAQRFATGLRQEGMDVVVSGIRAYSTLGWFDDPVLNTFLDLPRFRLAGLIFHELAHQRLYIDNDSTFNEGFATALQIAGVNRYLERYGSPAERERHRRARQRQRDFLALVEKTRERLRDLYDEPLEPAVMRAAKREVLEGLRAEYARLRERWGGYAGYDAWFAGDLNNARLAAVATYQDYVPAFLKLLESVGGDFEAFYRAAEALGSLPPAERRKRLRLLLSPGPPDSATPPGA